MGCLARYERPRRGGWLPASLKVTDGRHWPEASAMTALVTVWSSSEKRRPSLSGPASLVAAAKTMTDLRRPSIGLVG